MTGRRHRLVIFLLAFGACGLAATDAAAQLLASAAVTNSKKVSQDYNNQFVGQSECTSDFVFVNGKLDTFMQTDNSGGFASRNHEMGQGTGFGSLDTLGQPVGSPTARYQYQNWFEFEVRATLPFTSFTLDTRKHLIREGEPSTHDDDEFIRQTFSCNASAVCTFSEPHPDHCR